jgi:hypothetical protein
MFRNRKYLNHIFTCLAVFALSGGFHTAAASTSASPTAQKMVETPPAAPKRMVVRQGEISYENATITEDATWRGTVTVRGSLVISAHTTVRIEPGTVVRFTRSAILRQTPRMVVMGRLHCSGKPDKPVLFTSNSADAISGEWGGILFLSTEKRNLLEHFQIEGADVALEAHHSNLQINGGRILNSGIGVLLHDSTANLASLHIGKTETGLEAHNSEVDLRDVVMDDNRSGLIAVNTNLTAASIKVGRSRQYGMSVEECRIRIRSSEFADNNVGAIIKGGEGQLFRSRFVRNRELALSMAGARVKVNSSLFADNLGDAVKVADRRSLIYGSAFTNNAGYNLINSGSESIVAIQNWWGSKEESQISEKLSDSARNSRSGQIIRSPWLLQKPSLLP